VSDAPVIRARAIAPLIAAAAPRIEAGRELPPDVLDALHGAGLFRCLLPRSCGGEETQPADYVPMIEAIAMADASTAWCLGQNSGCAMTAAYLKPEIAQEIWGSNPRGVLAWGMAPGSIATVVDGGYRVTGRWHFASGSRHATWLGAHCNVRERDGSLRAGEDGKPIERTMLFPRDKAAITDNWRVLGLRGTGSDSYGVTDLFVPDDYSVDRESDAERREPGTLYQFTAMNLYASGFAGVALGIARGALDEFLLLVGVKTPTGSVRALRESGVVQRELALAEARLRAARGLLLQTLRDTWDAIAARGHMTMDERMSIRLATTFAIHQAKEVVQVTWQEAGATAIFDANPFERRFRDMHTVTQQVQGRSTHFEAVGQHMLGLTPNMRFI
jgi:alkylation response protein AidB-like acyl-CoA dehydrogenase